MQPMTSIDCLRAGGREAHREYGFEAGRFTREQVLKAGLWPASLPRVEPRPQLDDQTIRREH